MVGPVPEGAPATTESARTSRRAGPPFEAVDRRVVSQAVHERLRAAILGGELAPGDPLPSERVLAEQFGVNRHAIREAIKRLQQARLVEVAHGGATRVLDWRRTAGLDILADLAFGDGRLPDRGVLRSALEMRQAIGTDVARRCAARGGEELAERLRAHVAASRTAPAEELADRYVELWNLLVNGSGNIAYRLAYNSLLAALEPIRELADAASEPEFRDFDAQEALVAAIAAGDAAVAGALAHELLGRMLARAERILTTEATG